MMRIPGRYPLIQPPSDTRPPLPPLESASASAKVARALARPLAAHCRRLGLTLETASARRS